MQIDEQFIIDIRDYVLRKTGKQFFGRIKVTPKDVMVSCPYHKEGQERKPSMGIQRFSDDRGVAGSAHCFTCHMITDLSSMLKYMLGSSYDEDEVEAKFEVTTSIAREEFIKKDDIGFAWNPIIRENVVSAEDLRYFRKYHSYLKNRNITEDTANVYDIGFDDFNQHITFPIKDMYGNCLGLGRRSINQKQYIYPEGFSKPLYGVFELPILYSYIWVVEGPFNLWSLYQYGKSGVALLGTGTQRQMKELLSLNCRAFVLALDGDDAGHDGTFKIGSYLSNYRKKVYVALVPNNQDINDMLPEQFYSMEVITFSEWIKSFH